MNENLGIIALNGAHTPALWTIVPDDIRSIAHSCERANLIHNITLAMSDASDFHRSFTKDLLDAIISIIIKPNGTISLNELRRTVNDVKVGRSFEIEVRNPFIEGQDDPLVTGTTARLRQLLNDLSDAEIVTDTGIYARSRRTGYWVAADYLANELPAPATKADQPKPPSLRARLAAAFAFWRHGQSA